MENKHFSTGAWRRSPFRMRPGKAYKRFSKWLGHAYGCLQISRHGFWFVDIPRTSSSSIRAELGARFGRAYGKCNVLQKEHARGQIFPDHLPAREMRDLLGNSTWNRIFTFTIVRNPWDRIYSIYNYRRKTNSIPNNLCFRDYVIAMENPRRDTDLFKYHGFRYGASDYVLGEDGQIIIDFIAKYENRDHDLGFIASRLNIPGFGALSIQNASPGNRHYSVFYDPETKEIIRRLFARDIELFDYTFTDMT